MERKQIIHYGRLLLMAVALQACFNNNDKKMNSRNNTNEFNKKGFYTTFSKDWDLDIIPLIEPFRLESTDRGQSWYLVHDSLISYSTEHGKGIENVKRFGISKNYFFGKDENSWFFYDTKSSLYASYKSEEELIKCLNSFNIPVTIIKSCKEYQEDISKSGKCYWFPNQGQRYNEEHELNPKNIVNLNAFGDDITNAGFNSPSSIKKQSNNIYFFRLSIDNKENDLLYFGINWKSFILIRDGIIVPVFIDSDNFNITLYTPFPIAQKKGIAENKRIYIVKMITIKE